MELHETTMELQKSIKEFHNWFMDLYTSMIGDKHELIALHSSIYGAS